MCTTPQAASPLCKKNGAAVLSQVFDSNSNRTQVTENGSTINATYDDKDQILTWGTLQFTHNLNGELVTITDSANLPAGSTNFTYNVFGHLKSVTLPNGSQITYLLDAFNRRVGKRVNGSLTKQFLWQDDLKIAAEYDGSGNLVSEFIYAESINAPDYMIRGGIKYKLVKDNLGSVLAVVNTANGVIAQQLTYSTYGQVLTDSNPGFQPFGFAGGLYDSDTKLVRFGAREYNGTIGRWMTKDPILFNGGDTNLYGYVLQDPVNYWDPTGYISTGQCMLIGAGIGAFFGGSTIVGPVGGAILGAQVGYVVCPEPPLPPQPQPPKNDRPYQQPFPSKPNGNQDSKNGEQC
jgi:RHS repeat-associated protein